MGLSCGVVYAEQACAPGAVAFLAGLSIIPTGSIPAQIPSLAGLEQDGSVALVELPGWYFVIGDVVAFLDEGLSERLRSASKDGKVLHIIAESTSGGLGFELHHRGIQLRKWLEVEGHVVANVGESLAIEPPGLFTGDPDAEGERDFWQVVALAERITGIDWGATRSLPARVYRI